MKGRCLFLILLVACIFNASAKSDKWVKRGDQAIAKQKIELSISFYTKAIGENPKLVLPYLKRAKAYRLSGQFKKSANDIRMALSIDPVVVRAYMQRSKPIGI